MHTFESSSAEQMPPPSAELVLFRVQLQALLAVMGPKKAGRLLDEMATILAAEARMADVFPIRAVGFERELAGARAEAFAWYRRAHPLLTAKIRT